MDIISHGLYGGIAYGRSSRVSYATAFLIGITPDLCSFGIFTVLSMLGFAVRPDWSAGPPDPSLIPQYVHTMYNVSHSLVIASLVIAFVWYVLGKHIVELFAWPLHVLVDIPTHASSFFPTPFLWPVSAFHINGVSWGTPWVFFSNIALLVVLYGWWCVEKRMKRGYRA